MSRIACGRAAGGRVLPAFFQLALIIVWHPVMLILVEAIPFDDLQEWSSYLWYRAGVTSSYVSDIQTFRDMSGSWSAALLATLTQAAIFVLLEALLGWIGYRILVRRPKPRWHRFVRFWWRTCIFGIFVVLVVMTLPSLVPASPGSPFALLGPVALGVFFCLGPGWFARREIIRRARRLGELCPVCRYCLHGIAADVCPECGTPLLPGTRGGYSVDRMRLRAITKRQGRRWIRVAKVAALLIVGAGVGHVGEALYRRHLKYRFTSHPVMFNTSRGQVGYMTCHQCDSVRITLMDGTIEYPIQSEAFADCSHHWDAGIAAWSATKLTAGDVLLVRRGGHYNAIRVLSAGRSRGNIRYEWYHQPNRSKGTFVDDVVEQGEKSSAGKIAFKDIDIPCDFGSIWYDYYYGGINPASQNTADPHYIAFAGKVDIAEIDAADPGWIYKTWEDGKPNGYEEDSTRIDVRLSDGDKAALSFIWGHVSPSIDPKSDEELARLRHILETVVHDSSVMTAFTTIWPAIRDEFDAGGRPGSSPIWDNLVGYRIAEVATQGLGRVRGVIVPVFRTVGQANYLAVQTDQRGVKVMMADIEMLRVGRLSELEVSENTNAVPVHTVPVQVRTTSAGLVEGIISFSGPRKGGLDFWLYPFKSLASAPKEFGGSIHLTVKTDEPSAIPLMRYEWIAFTDALVRTCPKCGEPAESVNWIVCPYDGMAYE